MRVVDGLMAHIVGGDVNPAVLFVSVVLGILLISYAVTTGAVLVLDALFPYADDDEDAGAGRRGEARAK